MDSDLWLELGGFIALLCCSAFFSGSETALTAASRARMHTLESEGNAKARLVNRLRERKDKLIGGLLLGNTLVNIFASAFATGVMIRIFGEAGVAYAAIGVTALILIFSEVLPKTLALLHPDKLALVLAPPVAVVIAVFSPVTYAIVKLVNGLLRLCGVEQPSSSAGADEQELRGAIQLFKDTMDIEEDQEKGAMLRSILDLADVQVAEIMVHRKNVRMINADWPVQRIVDEVLHSAFTRLPVCKESQDNIIGIIHAKLLLQEMRHCGGDLSKINIANAMLEPWFIPESTTLFDQLQAFRKRREHFAVMVDEYGILRGVITLEDILEEIVGQIDDEHDTAVTGVHPQPDGSYVVDGKVTIRDLNRELDWGLPDDEYSTVGGLILFESQRIPAVGQVFTFFGFRFEILKKQRNQISAVRVMRVPETAGEKAVAGAEG